MMYVPEYFILQEVLPQDFFWQWYSRGDRLWQVFDARALVTADRLRRRYGPIVINNWDSGGEFSLSGFRPFDSEVGADLSQHKFGRALDCKFKDLPADEVRAELRARPALECFDLITCVEEMPGMTWFHFDVRNHDRARLGILWVKG